MKIFIAGPRAITQLDNNVTDKLFSIYEKGHDVFVGDAAGVDTAVQRFYADKTYNNVTVFASNGKARNNIGNWKVENVIADDSLKKFDFYKQKDVAMASMADYGFMVWNGESKGTLNNIINLIRQKKPCLVYFTPYEKFFTIDDEDKCLKLLSLCPTSIISIYNKLTQTPPIQIAMF